MSVGSNGFFLYLLFFFFKFQAIMLEVLGVTLWLNTWLKSKDEAQESKSRIRTQWADLK